MRPLPDRPSAPEVLLIGASTGGPQALTILVKHLAPAVPRLAICVTLHTPAELMPIMAAHVARACDVETRIVTTQQPLCPGRVYFAPGNRHLAFKDDGRDAMDVGLAPGIPRDACKPAVDAMFAAGAASFGPRAVGIVLSGMGIDGLAGAREIVAAGGRVIVQDKASSPVWGMPGAVAKAELASAILPPKELADYIVAACQLPARLA